MFVLPYFKIFQNVQKCLLAAKNNFFPIFDYQKTGTFELYCWRHFKSARKAIRQQEITFETEKT